MKKRSKLFSHFVAILHALALAIPLIAFAVVSLQDALPKWFSSQAVQHHGGTNDEFSDDLDYSLDNLQTRTMNQNLFHTLDELNYLNYESSTGQVYKQSEYHTNEVNSINDLVVGNVYEIQFTGQVLTNNPVNTYMGDYRNYQFLNEFVYLNKVNNNFKYILIRNISSSNSGFFIARYSDITTSSTVYLSLTANRDYYNVYHIPFVYMGYDNSIGANAITFIKEADLTNITPQYELISEGGDISSFDEYMEYYQNANFSTIVSEGTKNNFIFNFDFISLFNQGVVNNGDSIASLLFINFYLNYIINISLIIFLPEVIMVFFDICRKFVYKFTDMGDKY